MHEAMGLEDNVIEHRQSRTTEISWHSSLLILLAHLQ
jgi:hypothetical protein